MKKTAVNPIELEVFKNRFASTCEEMGVALCRSSFSPNIKERQDFSCAIFDRSGALVAQAAHIPVHLGSMPLSVAAAIRAFKLEPGDTVILNDPYQGGTHLPDITLVAPVFLKGHTRPTFFVANRAHHSDVGGQSPGSMPLAGRLEDEGVIIPPTLFRRRGRMNHAFMRDFLKRVRGVRERRADLLAQRSANAVGERRLKELVEQYGERKTLSAMGAYQDYKDRITRQALRRIPEGIYRFEDFLDDDGLGTKDIKITVKIHVSGNGVLVDFTGSHPQTKGPVNATYAITLSAVAYVFRCIVVALTGEDCVSLRRIHLKTRKGTVVDSRYPAPVAGGNVETSQRIVDVLLGALAKALPRIIPAAGQGTMNNVAMGSDRFTYYETIGGGMGACPNADGASAIHSHMTNTLNTPIEALESELPLRITAYHVRKNTGGQGAFRGGDGLIREYQFLQAAHVSLLTERRRRPPYGLRGGAAGEIGRNWLIRGAKRRLLPAKVELTVATGDKLRIETPGGGGFGKK
jgi:N-methylhydantoinase B